MPKILLINNCYPTALYPHRSTYIHSIEEGLVKAGIPVDRIVLYSNHSSTWGKIVSYLNFYRQLLVFHSYRNYDYIYIHHFPFACLSLIPHMTNFKKVIINWHGEDLMPSTTTKKFLCSLSYNFIKANYIHVVPSDYLKEILIEKIRAKPENIIVSPSGGVDIKLFAPSGRENNRSDIVNIGFASGITKEKGIDYVLYALKHQDLLPKKVAFHIINYGRESGTYFNEISKKENVFLYPVFKKQDMNQYYNKIDMLAFPTKKESLGLVALEAMSCGVPVVGPSHFALKSIIINGSNGESYKNFSHDDFFNALKRCMLNLGNYSPRKTVVKHYSKEYVVQQYQEIFV